MKLTCMPGPLGQALQAVSRAISARTTLPILNNILVSATDQGLVLTATNLEIGIRKLVPAEISEEGSTTVPARLLTDFVSTLPDQELSLTFRYWEGAVRVSRATEGSGTGSGVGYLELTGYGDAAKQP